MPLWRWRKAPKELLLPLNSQELLVVLRVPQHRRVVLVHLREGLRGWKGQGVRPRLGIELLCSLLHAFHRRDVVRPDGPLRGDGAVVHEVHVRRGRRHAPSERNEHVVRPDDPAVGGYHPVELRLAEIGDIAGPRHRCREVPFGQNRPVVVAVELADLARAHSLLEPREGAIEGRVSHLGGIVPVLEHDQPERVAHRVPDTDPALQLRILEELLDGGDRVGDALVPGDAVHAGRPRERVVAVRVEGRVLLRRDEVLDVRDQAFVELLRPLVVDVLGEEAVVVGRDDDVASDSLALRKAPLHLREVFGVGVDLLVVVDLDPRLLLELLQCRRLMDAGGFERLRRVDVVRPGREVEDVLDLASAARAATTSAGREQRREREQCACGGTASHQLLAGHPLLGHSDASSPCSTTKVDSGLQLNVTFDPTAGMRAPESMFCAKTCTVPALVSTTTCVATPIYAVSATLPSSSFAPPPRPIVIFSGRTPAATAPVLPSTCARTTAPVSRRTASGPSTSPVSRFEIPRKPATNAVAGRS